MWLEITIIPFILGFIVFLIFWIVHEGSRWQKHRYLGGFARTIQASPRRAFLIFFLLTIMFIPLAVLVMTGLWLDTMPSPQKSDLVNVMLLTLVVLAGAFPVMWGSFRTWRQTVRAEAEMKIRPTGT
jgi:membrane protein YdbS with pleckstrin-like domain